MKAIQIVADLNLKLRWTQDENTLDSQCVPLILEDISDGGLHGFLDYDPVQQPAWPWARPIVPDLDLGQLSKVNCTDLKHITLE